MITDSGGERFLRKCLGNLHKELIGLTRYAAQLKFIEKAAEIEDVIGHFHILYKDSKGKNPTALMVVCQMGIRIHKISKKYNLQESFPKLQFEYSWTGISSFQIENKKLILRPENQPSCRKMVYFCGYHERARYLLSLITNAHIFDYHQTKQYPHNEQKMKHQQRELSVDNWSPGKGKPRLKVGDDYDKLF